MSIDRHINTETQEYRASHPFFGTQMKNASQSKAETQVIRASQLKFGNQPQNASQEKVEAQFANASHRLLGTHAENASQVLSENHKKAASHKIAETRPRGAKKSHTSAETLIPNAKKEFDYEEDAEERRRGWEKRMREFFGRLKRPRLRILVETFYDIQKLRIALSNRLYIYKKFNILVPEQRQKLEENFEGLKKVENSIGNMIKVEVSQIPVYELYLKNIRGIGPAMAAGLIAHIDDIGKFDTVSKLWKNAGLAPGQKRVAGEKLGYNPELKTHCWKIITQLMMAKNPIYYAEYSKAKECYLTREDIKAKHEEMASNSKSASVKKSLAGYKEHIDRMAKRKMIKLFLCHLYVRWRKMENLPVRPPYAVEKLGHSYVEPPKTEEEG